MHALIRALRSVVRFHPRRARACTGRAAFGAESNAGPIACRETGSSWPRCGSNGRSTGSVVKKT